MEKSKTRIGEGKLEVFLVCDKQLCNHESPFLDWLITEGFGGSDHKGSYGCPWLHVNLSGF